MSKSFELNCKQQHIPKQKHIYDLYYVSYFERKQKQI